MNNASQHSHVKNVLKEDLFFQEIKAHVVVQIEHSSHKHHKNAKNAHLTVILVILLVIVGVVIP